MRRVLPPTAAVAIAGAAIMAVEILLPRRLAPDLGTTLPVWTAVFVTVLLGLAIGSSLGRGRDDDARASRRETLRWLLAAVAIAATPHCARLAADATTGLSLTPRSLLAMAAGGLLPCIALGSIYPVAVARALRGVVERGPALGRISAAGAIGSLAGTWLTSYVVIPNLHVSAAFYAVAGLVGLAAALRAGGDPVRGTRGPSSTRHGTHSTTPQTAARAHSPPASAPAPVAPIARLALLAAVVGAITLAMEVVAARRAAVNAGSSLEAWTAVISVVLVGLALGGALGGWWASRQEARRASTTALLLSAALAAATPWTAREIHVFLAWESHSFAVRVAIGVLLAYGPLFVALGTIPPILARAAVAGAPDAGRRAGLMYASGTLGALGGTLIVGPLVLPALRLEGAAMAAALALAVAAVALARRRAIPTLAVVAFLGLLAVARLDVEPAREAGLSIGLRSDADRVWVRDGAYARVVIEDSPPDEIVRLGRPFRRMRIDARIHGVHDPKDPAWVGSYYGSLYAAASERLMGARDAIRAVFLGGGTYTAPRTILRRWPKGHVDVAEIDPDVTRAAREELSLNEAPPGLSVFHEDGRAFVRSLPEHPPPDALYDLVVADAFGDVGVPWHLTTVEFARECKARLAPDGAYLANTIDVLERGGFMLAMRATLRTVFRNVEVIGVGRNDPSPMNFVFVASDAPLDLGGLTRVDPVAPNDWPIPVYRYDPRELDALEKKAGARPLTDDFAPVESLLAPVVNASAWSLKGR